MKHILKTISLMAVALLLSVSASANNRFYIEDFTITAGETKDIALHLINDTEFAGFQADVTLPDGLEFVYNDDEFDYCWVDTDRINYKAFSCSSAFQDEEQKILRMIVVYTKSGAVITGNEGELMHIRVKATDSFSGSQTITLSNIEFSTPAAEKYIFDSTSAIVTAPDILAEQIELSQSELYLEMYAATQLTANILPETTTNKKVVWASSDNNVATVDENGLVTSVATGIATITATTADGSNLSASCIVTVSDPTPIVNRLYIEDFTITAGETKDIALHLTNDAEFAGFQADVTLPDGLEFVYNDDEFDYCWVDADRINYKAFSCSSAFQDEEQKILRMIVVYTKSGAVITGNEGELMHIRVKASDSFSGSQTITLSNIEFSTPTAERYLFETTTATVSDSSADNIEGVGLTIMSAFNGKITFYVETGKQQSIEFTPNDGYTLHSLTYNNEDVTNQVINNIFTTPEISEDTVISAVFATLTGVNEVIDSQRVRVMTSSDKILVKNTVEGEVVYFYNDSGFLLASAVSTGDTIEYKAEPNKIYIVKTSGYSAKVLM